MPRENVNRQKDEIIDEAVPEFMAEMVDDLEYIPRNERIGRAGRLKRKTGVTPFLVIASVALIVMVVLAVAFANKKPAGGATGTLEAGLLRIEERLKELETKIARIERSLNPTQNEKEKTVSHPKSRTRYHTVRAGDNLSAIALKYGLTVDRLCQLNRLTVDEPIKPDQKLLVSSN